jgi:hypothetical protein
MAGWLSRAFGRGQPSAPRATPIVSEPPTQTFFSGQAPEIVSPTLAAERIAELRDLIAQTKDPEVRAQAADEVMQLERRLQNAPGPGMDRGRPQPAPQEEPASVRIANLDEQTRRAVRRKLDEIYQDEFDRLNPGGEPIGTPVGSEAHEAAVRASEEAASGVISQAVQDRNLARTAAFNRQFVSQGDLAARVRSDMTLSPAKNQVSGTDLGGDAFSRKDPRPDHQSSGRYGPLGQSGGGPVSKPWEVGIRRRPTISEEQASLMGAIEEARARGNEEQALFYENELDNLMRQAGADDSFDQMLRQDEVLQKMQEALSQRVPVQPAPAPTPARREGPLGDRVRQAARALQDRPPALAEGSAGKAMYDQISGAMEVRFQQAEDGSYVAGLPRNTSSQQPVSVGLGDPQQNRLATQQLAERYGLRLPVDDADAARFYSDLVESIAREKMSDLDQVSRGVLADPSTVVRSGDGPVMQTSAGADSGGMQVVSMPVPRFEVPDSAGRLITVGGGSRLVVVEPSPALAEDGSIDFDLRPVADAQVVRYAKLGEGSVERLDAGGRRRFDAPEETAIVVVRQGQVFLSDGTGTQLTPAGREDLLRLQQQGFVPETAQVGVPGSLDDLRATEAGREIPGVTADLVPERTFSQREAGGEYAPDATVNPDAVAAEIRNLVGPSGLPADASQPTIDVAPDAAQRVLRLLEAIDANPGSGATRRQVLARASNLPDADSPEANAAIEDLADRLNRLAAGETVAHPADISFAQKAEVQPGVVRGGRASGQGPQGYGQRIAGQIGPDGISRLRQYPLSTELGVYLTHLENQLKARPAGAPIAFSETSFLTAADGAHPLAYIAMSRAKQKALAEGLATSFRQLAERANGSDLRPVAQALRGTELGLPDGHKDRLLAIFDEQYQSTLRQVSQELDALVGQEFPDASVVTRQTVFSPDGAPLVPPEGLHATVLQRLARQLDGVQNTQQLNELLANETAGLDIDQIRPEDARLFADLVARRREELLNPSQGMQDLLEGVGVRNAATGGNPAPAADARIRRSPGQDDSVAVGSNLIPVAQQIFDEAGIGRPAGVTSPAESRAQTRTNSREKLQSDFDKIRDIEAQITAVSQNKSLSSEQRAAERARLIAERDSLAKSAVPPRDATVPQIDLRRKALAQVLYGDSVPLDSLDAQGIDDSGRLGPQPGAAQRAAREAGGDSDQPLFRYRSSSEGPSYGGPLLSVFESIFGTRTSSAAKTLQLLDPDVPSSNPRIQELKRQVQSSGGLNAVVREMIAKYAADTGVPVNSRNASADALGNLTSDMIRMYRDQSPLSSEPAPRQKIVIEDDAAAPEGRPPLNVTESTAASLRRLAAEARYQAASNEVARATAVRDRMLESNDGPDLDQRSGLARAERLLQDAEAALQETGGSTTFNAERARTALRGANNFASRTSGAGGDVSVIRQAAQELSDSLAMLGTEAQTIRPLPDRRPTTPRQAPATSRPMVSVEDAGLQRLIDEGNAHISDRDAPELQAQLRGDFYADVERKARLEQELATVNRNLETPFNLDDQVTLSQRRQELQAELDAMNTPGRRAAFSSDTVRLALGTDDDGKQFVQVVRDTRGTNQPPQLTSQRRYYIVPEGAGTVAIARGAEGVQLRRPEAETPVDGPLDWPDDVPRLGGPAPNADDAATYSYEGTPFDYEDGPSSAMSTRPRQGDAAPSESTADRIRQAVDEASGEPGPAKVGEAESPPPDAGSGKPKRRIFNRKNAGRAAFMGAGAAMYGASQNEEIADRVRELLGENTAGNGLPSFMSSASAAEIGAISDTNNPEAVSPEEAALDRLSRPAGRVRPVRYFTYYNPLPR